MKPIGEYYSDDETQHASVLVLAPGRYKVVMRDTRSNTSCELHFHSLQEAEDYAEDYVMGCTE